MKKLLILSAAVWSLSAFGQLNPDFKIYGRENKFGPNTIEYFSKNDEFVYRKGEYGLMTQGGLVYKTDATNFSPELIKRMVDKFIPDVNSRMLFTLDWEAGPFHDMKNHAVTDEEFKVAEAKLIGLIAEVKKHRPHLRVSLYGFPYRAYKASLGQAYNGDGRLDKVIAKLDFITPSVYILYADERFGHERNLEYINLNLDVALRYGKKHSLPVIPFVWHVVHPNDKIYGSQVIQKEVFASYIKHIKNHSVDGWKAAGVQWWVDSLYRGTTGINNHLSFPLGDDASYDQLLLDHAKEVVKQLREDNKAPVANAGVSRTVTLPTSSVTLTGSGTDSDGTVRSYAWTQVSGPGTASFSSTTAAAPTVSQLTAGSYVFSLKVKDNQGATSAASQVTITVQGAANKPPVANAGTSKTITLPTSSVMLNGSGSDSDGTISSYAWSRVSGPSQATFSSAATPAPTVAPLVAGTYVFSLTVKDNKGAVSAPSQVSVTVNRAANQVPVANAGADKAVTLPTTSVALGGSGSDPDGTIAAYRWHQVSGPTPAAFSNAGVAAPTVTQLSKPGNYLFNLTVIDDKGASSAASQVTVSVKQPVDVAQRVVSYTLIDADTDKAIMTLAHGATLDLNALPTRRLNIRANTQPASVGSVVLTLGGPQARKWTESNAPYALFSNDGADYAAWTPKAGSYTLSAVPYSAKGAAGIPGAPLSITFTVKD